MLLFTCNLFNVFIALKFSRAFLSDSSLFLRKTAALCRNFIICVLTFSFVFGPKIPPFSNLLITGFAFMLLPYLRLNSSTLEVFFLSFSKSDFFLSTILSISNLALLKLDIPPEITFVTIVSVLKFLALKFPLFKVLI